MIPDWPSFWLGFALANAIGCLIVAHIAQRRLGRK